MMVQSWNGCQLRGESCGWRWFAEEGRSVIRFESDIFNSYPEGDAEWSQLYVCHIQAWGRRNSR